MATRDKILTWVSIIIGSGVVLGLITTGVVFYVNHAVAESFANAKPASVATIETDIRLIRNDIEHIVDDVAENTRVAQDTNKIFREYLEDQAR